MLPSGVVVTPTEEKGRKKQRRTGVEGVIFIRQGGISMIFSRQERIFMTSIRSCVQDLTDKICFCTGVSSRLIPLLRPVPLLFCPVRARAEERGALLPWCLIVDQANCYAKLPCSCSVRAPEKGASLPWCLIYDQANCYAKLP